tara:strand:+ start:10309 stop:11625 length:1317 start_codon:yes stop_codon:yes gene_type:complete
MSTRFSKQGGSSESIPTGYEGTSVPDFEIPSCTIEDVDRGLFNLFNEEIPFYFQLEEQSRRVPVIFATGERFAILRRNRPLRDKAGALILPLISMIRTSISQEVSRGSGPGQTQPLVVKKRLDKRDPEYQRLINRLALKNQDDVATTSHKLEGKGDGTKPGTVGTRRQVSLLTTPQAREGKLLTSDLSRNIFEIITIPPVKHFMATYEITFWTQYTQQMNDMATALMSSYQNMHKRTFRLETDKGYWFVGYVTADLSSNSNLDDFTDSERIIKYTFTVEVPAFIVNPSYPGSPNALRSFMSAPDVNFEVIQSRGNLNSAPKTGPISGDPNKFILQALDSTEDDFPGTSLAEDSKAGSDDRNLEGGTDAVKDKTANIGGATAGKLPVTAPKLKTDPFTGEKLPVPVPGKVTTNKGETSYKDLNTGKVNIEFGDLTDLDL